MSTGISISKVTKIISLVLLCSITISCDQTSPTQSQFDDSSPQSPIRLREWSWPDDERQTQFTPINGRLLISARPNQNSSFAPTQLVVEGSELPQHLQIQLSPLIQLSGTISIAADSASPPSPISIEGWMISQPGELEQSLQIDQDPFSTAQLLFSVPRTTSTATGQLRAIRFQLYTQGIDLPPFHFDRLPLPRFDLKLPPRSELLNLEVQTWLDFDTLTPINQANISIWKDHERVSIYAPTTYLGAGNITLWTSTLQSFSPDTVLSVRVQPSSSDQLPSLTQNISVAELRTLIEEQRPLVLHYPRLGSTIQLPLRVNIEDNESGTWHISISQTWSEQVDQSEATLPDNPDFTRRRGRGQWQSSTALRLNQSVDLTAYRHSAVLMIRPDFHSERRTQRIEQTVLRETDIIQLNPLPKPLVRGQLRDEQDVPVEATLRMIQLAWPWPDAEHLSLQTYHTQTDAIGGFTQSVEPGVYALAIHPSSPLLAPRVVLFKVPESEGVLLGPQQSIVKLGRSVMVSLGIQVDGIESHAGRVSISCLIPPTDPIFQGSSQRNQQATPFSIPIYHHTLPINSSALVTLHEESCPQWSGSEGTEIQTTEGDSAVEE